MTDNSKLSKEFKAAQKRAARRKAALNKALLENAVNEEETSFTELDREVKPKQNATPKMKREKVSKPKSAIPKEFSIMDRFFLWVSVKSSITLPVFSFLAAFIVSWGIIETTPLVSGKWDWTGLGFIFVSLLFVYLSLLVASVASVFTKFVSASLVLLVLVFTSVGAYSQVVVNGKAQLAGSVLDRAERNNVAILQDIQVIEDNQKLLELPLEQSRGIADLYTKAIAVNLDIAARWNPAIVTDLPSPGYMDVYRKVNAAADLQASALGLYIANMEQYDNARQEQIVSSRFEVSNLIAGPSGAAFLLNDVATSLGLTLDLSGGG